MDFFNTATDIKIIFRISKNPNQLIIHKEEEKDLVIVGEKLQCITIRCKMLNYIDWLKIGDGHMDKIVEYILDNCIEGWHLPEKYTTETYTKEKFNSLHGLIIADFFRQYMELMDASSNGYFPGPMQKVEKNSCSFSKFKNLMVE